MGSTQSSSQRSARVELGELSEISHIWVRMVFRGKPRKGRQSGQDFLGHGVDLGEGDPGVAQVALSAFLCRML